MLGKIEKKDVGLVGEELHQDGTEPQSANKVKLLIAEEQEIFRVAYKSFFSQHPNIEAIRISADTDGELLVGKARELKPGVILLGIGVLQPASVKTLEMLRENCPEVAIVLLSASYDASGFVALRRFSRGSSGCAYLLKHTMNSVRELTEVILGVAQGRITIDPPVWDGLMAAADSPTFLLKELSPRDLLKELSPREQEVLGWMAKGFRNSTIAEVLYLELKTVERHINSIFSKLGDCPDTKDPRVNAITLYLRAMGRLPLEDFDLPEPQGPTTGRGSR
jgi:two-component system nitrate/nitrite response regulator NarL